MPGNVFAYIKITIIIFTLKNCYFLSFFLLTKLFLLFYFLNVPSGEHRMKEIAFQAIYFSVCPKIVRARNSSRCCSLFSVFYGWTMYDCIFAFLYTSYYYGLVVSHATWRLMLNFRKQRRKKNREKHLKPSHHQSFNSAQNKRIPIPFRLFYFFGHYLLLFRIIFCIKKVFFFVFSVLKLCLCKSWYIKMSFWFSCLFL